MTNAERDDLASAELSGAEVDELRRLPKVQPGERAGAMRLSEHRVDQGCSW